MSNLSNNSLNGTLNGVLNGVLNSILTEIRGNNKITQKELAEKLGISIRTINRNIMFLRENGYIERIGSKKTGEWKIIKD